MPGKFRWRRAVEALRNRPVDLLDLIVIGAAAVLVAGLVVVSVFSATRRTQNVAFVAPYTAAPTSTPTPTAAERAIVHLISTPDAAPLLEPGLATASGADVALSTGSGYTDSESGFAAAAGKVGADAALVVIVPSNADGGAPPLQETAGLAKTVAAVRKGAPNAKILVVGPVAGDAQSGSVKAVGGALFTAAKSAKLHYIAGTGRGWVGTDVDATNGFPTADALKTVGLKLGAEAKVLLAD